MVLQFFLQLGILWEYIQSRCYIERILQMIKVKRYLGNTSSLEVHDTQKETTNCQLGEIKVDHRRWYDTLSEAKADRDYDNCSWCLGGSAR